MSRPCMRWLGVAAAGLSAAVAGAAWAQAAAPKRHYDVAAFVWPSYHPDDRAKVFWPMGIGEWETVMKNAPHFEGHDQPRFPLWGYLDAVKRVFVGE